MELGPKKPSLWWFLGPDSIMVVYMVRFGHDDEDDGDGDCNCDCVYDDDYYC